MNYFRLWWRVEDMQKLLRECYEASMVGDLAAVSTALSSVHVMSGEIGKYVEWVRERREIASLQLELVEHLTREES